MFGLFKSKEKVVTELVSEIKNEANKVSPAPNNLQKEDYPVYQIGKTADGRVTFRLHNDWGYTTITMNNQAVDQLIRMLESAKDQPANTEQE